MNESAKNVYKILMINSGQLRVNSKPLFGPINFDLFGKHIGPKSNINKGWRKNCLTLAS